MAFPLPHYHIIKENYCLLYLGNCSEYLTLLLGIREHIEKQFPMKIWIGCRDEFVSDYPRMIGRTDLEKHKLKFGQIEEIKCDLVHHPIDLFLEDNDIRPFFSPSIKPLTYSIASEGNFPTKSLTDEQQSKLEQLFNSRKLKRVPSNGDWVVGVESCQLFQAIFDRKCTSLVPTGIGTDLYRKLTGPFGEILHA